MTHGENGAGGVDILAKLHELEQGEAAKGWDVPATLWFLLEDGTLLQTPGEVPQPAPEALQVLARLLQLPVEPFPQLQRDITRRNAVAVAFVCEAWQNDQFTTELDRMRDPRALADIPGTVEIRMVSAVTLDGSRYWVSRVRGQEPEGHRAGDREDEWQVGGRVFEALSEIAETLRQAREETTA